MNLKHRLIPLLGVAASSFALLIVTSCQKKGPAEAGGKIVSAEKTSFKEVTAHLDPGGNLYVYLSTEQWLKGISSNVVAFRQMAADIPGMSDAERANANKVIDLVTHLIQDSGIEDVSGFGLSSIASEPGFYHSKAILHHYKGEGSGFLWNVFGPKPHALDELDLLPTNTALAFFSDLDLPMLWSVIQKEANQSGFPQARQFLDKLPANVEKATGVPWDKLLASLGGEFGFVLTLDDTTKIPVPLPTKEPLEVPEPGIMLVIKINDDTIFNRVDQALKDAHQQPVSVNDPDLKMRTIQVPVPLPIQLRPSIATSGGYLFVASSDSLIKEALAVKSGKKPGLKSTDEFKHLSKDVPTQGNQISYVSQRFGQTFMKIQQQAMEMNQNAPAGAQNWMKSFYNPDKAVFSYAVGANTDEGWLTVGNGNQNSSQMLLLAAVVAPVGILSAIAIPNFVKARDTAQKNACINNLRQIDAAKSQWALENRKPTTATPTEDDLKPYLKNRRFPVCPKGGTYSINSLNEKPTCSIPGHTLD